MSTIPYVFVIDIDGTLIGDISPQVMVYDIVQEIRKNHGKISHDLKDLKDKLKNGIIRPHFVQFVSEIQKHYKDVELFIYTASQKKWAEFLIKIIESVIDVKFNRPIFTRNDCMYIDHEYKKSLSKIKGRILKTLKRKYPSIQLSDLREKMLMIDNSRVFHSSDDNNVLICPTYSFKYPENIPCIFRKDLFERYHKIIYGMISRYMFGIQLTSSYLKFQRFYYQMYVNELSKMKNPDDKFWLILKDILIKKNIHRFDARSVKYMNNKVDNIINLPKGNVI